MGANFKPTMSSISDMKPFRFWCQKVLPTVYDDSLSYYELLNKVVIYLNQTVDNVDLLNDNVTRLYEAYVLLEGYVNDYFNQDFPALVEEKLDEMAEDGTLTELITTYIDPYIVEINARLNNFISAHSGLTGETILWSGIGAGQGFELTLTDDPRNYNYIDVHYKYRVTINSIENAQFVNAIQRFTSDVFFDDNVVINVPNANDEQMYITHTLMFRSTSSAPWVYRIGVAQRVSWDGVASNPSISQEVDYQEGVTPTDFTGGCITKIVGVKQVADSEVIDARVGADGTIYPTLEDRLNTENNELKEQIQQESNGQPVPVTLAEEMTDEEKIYLYLGEEEGYDYGYIYVFVNDEWTATSVYGKGTDGYSPSATVTQTVTGAEITITDKTGTTTASITNGTATQEQVDSWLDDHPEATTTVQDGSITKAKLANDVLSAIELNDDLWKEVESAYYHPTYTQGTLNNDGTLNTSGIGQVSNYLPVIGGEKLTLASTLTGKIAYYDSSQTFISLSSVSTGIKDYTVPFTAKFARFQNVYSNGKPCPLFVRKKRTIPSNKTLYDLIFSPLNATPNICMSGDSNTYGYGLSNRETQAWAYLFGNALSNISNLTYGLQSKWVETIGGQDNGTGYKLMNYQQMSIWTNATTVYFSCTSYSATWDWYVDDAVQSESATSNSITLDGNMHKVTVRATGGQLAYPTFRITKTITYTNIASTGVGIGNVPVDDGYDWLLIMIGTNNRTSAVGGDGNINFTRYSNHGTFIVPFPNHKDDPTYTVSEMRTYAGAKNIFESLNYEILDCSDIVGNLFYDNSFYQSDLIHFNAEGHRRIANIIAGRLGFPLYLKATS